MPTVKTVRTVHTGSRKRVVEGTAQVYRHTVKYYYDVGGFRLSDDDHDALREEAEERARHLIREGYRSGILACTLLTAVRRHEREFSGWWTVQS